MSPLIPTIQSTVICESVLDRSQLSLIYFSFIFRLSFLLRARVEFTVILSPAPASSHAASGFPALRAPAHFSSKFMGPHELGVLSATLVYKTRDRHQIIQASRTAIAYSTVSSQSPGAYYCVPSGAESSFPPTGHKAAIHGTVR